MPSRIPSKNAFSLNEKGCFDLDKTGRLGDPRNTMPRVNGRLTIRSLEHVQNTKTIWRRRAVLVSLFVLGNCGIAAAQATPRLPVPVYTTIAGVTVGFVRASPPGPAKTVVLLASTAALALEAEPYNRIGAALYEDGWAVMSVDLPGHGSNVTHGELPDQEKHLSIGGIAYCAGPTLLRNSASNSAPPWTQP